jgi:hypothetical protein
MKKSLLLSIVLLLSMLSFSQDLKNLPGLKFQEYNKTTGTYTRIEFGSNKQVSCVMGGVLPISNRSYREVCPGTYTITGNKITIKCVCADKDLFPDPIEDSFTYDSKTKSLISTRYKYSSGSAPTPSLVMKSVIWQPVN